MNGKNFNEILKQREAREKLQESEDNEMRLDDARRVKVLSPGRLVFKRFMRNRLAIVGSIILIVMFLFSFAGPLFYSYSQTQIFYKYEAIPVNYASATERTEYVAYQIDPNIKVHYSVSNSLNTYIPQMESQGTEQMDVTGTDGSQYSIQKLGDNVYVINSAQIETVASFGSAAAAGTYNSFTGECTMDAGALDAIKAALDSDATEFTYDGRDYVLEMAKKSVYNIIPKTDGGFTYTGEALDSGFEDAASAAAEAGSASFSYDGRDYALSESNGAYTVSYVSGTVPAMVGTNYVLDAYESGSVLSDSFKTSAYMALYGDGSFTADGTEYTIKSDGDEHIIYKGESEFAMFSTFVVRAYSGEDSLAFGFKKAAQEVIEEMEAGGLSTSQFTYELPELGSSGEYLYDENGNLIYVDTDITVTRKTGQYVLSCDQTSYLIDIYASPSLSHPVGTDGDGMDVLARMMYGGRVSLLVGFVVVILETLLGIIMGGIAGYFGGWVDNLIMRLVDIFYCIPTLPIMIILGALFDSMKMNAYMRLMWMMAVLGFLGWASVARLVRGQILSLREQEFMTAAEATGIRAGRRIFRHLIPNVMPQLIVTATMGLGSVILYESTLSFLGLGVKHPLATWGTMINSVASSAESMVRYSYIWIPVGCLICLTVIAFNFVGDGLRDAFDPKMKR